MPGYGYGQWLLIIIIMKINLFERIEMLRFSISVYFISQWKIFIRSSISLNFPCCFVWCLTITVYMQTEWGSDHALFRWIFLHFIHFDSGWWFKNGLCSSNGATHTTTNEQEREREREKVAAVWCMVITAISYIISRY